MVQFLTGNYQSPQARRDHRARSLRAMGIGALFALTGLAVGVAILRPTMFMQAASEVAGKIPAPVRSVFAAAAPSRDPASAPRPE